MQIQELISEGLSNMFLGMLFVFLFLGILVGFMHLLTAERKRKSPEAEAGAAGPGPDLPAAALELEPAAAAAVAMALFQSMSGPTTGALPGPEGAPASGSAWRESGRKRIMGQREMWFWRKG